MSISVYLAVPLFILITVLQAALFSRFSLLGVTPQVAPLLVLAWGYMRGAHEGITWAFVAGLLLDLFSVTPIGSTSLALISAALVLSFTRERLPSGQFFAPLLLATLGMLTFLLADLLLLRILGYPTSWSGPVTLPLAALLHGGLMLPLLWLGGWLGRLFRPRRESIATGRTGSLR